MCHVQDLAYPKPHSQIGRKKTSPTIPYAVSEQYTLWFQLMPMLCKHFSPTKCLSHLFLNLAVIAVDQLRPQGCYLSLESRLSPTSLQFVKKEPITKLFAEIQILTNLLYDQLYSC